MKNDEEIRSMEEEAERIRKNLEKTEANQLTNADGKHAILPDEPGTEINNDGFDSFATD